MKKMPTPTSSNCVEFVADSYAKVERTCGKRAVENHFLIWKTHDLYRWKREKGKMSTI
jgi:hypothetical protein